MLEEYSRYLLEKLAELPVQTPDPGRQYLVYKHTEPKTNKIYIGITKQDSAKRWGNGTGYKYKNPLFYKAIQQNGGWKSYRHEIVKGGLSQEQANILEERLIKKYDSMNPAKGYNLRAGGFSNLPGESVRKHLSEALMGHPVDEATRAKIKASMPVKAVQALDMDGNVVATYPSLTEAANAVGSAKPNIFACCNGLKHTAKGYRWRYANNS